MILEFTTEKIERDGLPLYYGDFEDRHKHKAITVNGEKYDGIEYIEIDDCASDSYILVEFCGSDSKIVANMKVYYRQTVKINEYLGKYEVV